MRCLGFVVFLNLIRAALFLTGKDGSVCNVQLSYMESRYVPYTETYKIRKWTFFHQTRSRTNYRIDHVPVWKLEERCCDGYEDRNNVCEPVCSPECVNGKCTSPNLCECDIGYSSVTQYECEPLCNTYCTNGFCARPNECSCNAGYELTESKLYCLPVCTQDCANRNAHCTEPNRCTCNWGYRQSDIDSDLPSCTPICEIPCVNGNCTEPNVCTCNPGYEEDIDRFVCKPKCERICLNGKCTAPNVCTCDPGYQLNENGECEPNCTEPCVMGTCIAPDVCSCYPGYGLPDDSRYVCEAVCEKACVNGTCTAPDVCTCHDGYRATGDDTMSHVCEPVCELPCEPRGHCAAPNTCNCIQGYRMIDMTAKENEVVVDTIVSGCEPVCDQDCANGTCTEPNVCTCNDGFEKDADDRCEPVCVSCHNGSCVAPDVCQCWEGFVRTEEFGCAPSCENGCENGECVAPNECVCHEGFESSGNNSDSTCVEHVPTCTTVCKGHGVCVEDEKPCECSYGWTGPECDQSTLCILVINPDDENLIGITIRNDTNSTLTNAKRYAPLCHRCDGRTNNESYCFAINDSSIGCFVETVESSCHRDELNAEFKMQTGMLEAVIILIVVVVTIACFVIYRHRRKKMRLAIVQNVLQETMANEYLISERDDDSAY